MSLQKLGKLFEMKKIVNYLTTPYVQSAYHTYTHWVTDRLPLSDTCEQNKTIVHICLVVLYTKVINLLGFAKAISSWKHILFRRYQVTQHTYWLNPPWQNVCWVSSRHNKVRPSPKSDISDRLMYFDDIKVLNTQTNTHTHTHTHTPPPLPPPLTHTHTLTNGLSHNHTIMSMFAIWQSKNNILPCAFKLRQHYLSTSYLDQKYIPSEQSERGKYELIQVT